VFEDGDVDNELRIGGDDDEDDDEDNDDELFILALLKEVLEGDWPAFILNSFMFSLFFAFNSLATFAFCFLDMRPNLTAKMVDRKIIRQTRFNFIKSN